MRFRAHSYVTFVFTPEPPIADWLADLDAWLTRSPGFFIGRPVVLDLSAVKLSGPAIAHLIASLAERGIRVIGLEGTDASVLGPELPPLLRRGRNTDDTQIAVPAVADKPVVQPAKQATSLLIDSPIRSGQSVVFTEGDITVLGSVGSGAEIVAGGSIHVYGTLRGRAMAGACGNPRARIFCSKIEAELLAIDGFYKTAEDIDASIRNRPAQAWLNGNMMMITALS
jgi:septum site-determining protein MinC